MQKLLPIAAMLAIGTGCVAVQDGVYLVILPVMDNFECESTIDENFNDAQVPDDGIVIGEWSYTTVAAVSDQALFMSVMEGPSNEVYVVMGDAVYTGTRDKGIVTTTWEHSTDDEYSEDHETGYNYSELNNTTTVETFTFEENKETGGLTGRYTIQTQSDVTYNESDRWDQAVGLLGGQIPAFLYLEGAGTANVPTTDECASDPCNLSIIQDCSGDIAFSGTYTNLPQDSFEAFENAGQDPG